MRRALVILLGVVLVVVALMLANLALNPIAAWAIARWGSALTGTPVDTEQVILQPYRGFARITGLELGRAPGFTARSAHLRELAVRADPATLLSDVVVVHEVTVDALQVTYERAERGGTNLDAIQRSIEGYRKSTGGSASGGDGRASGGRRYVIGKLTIRNVRVTMTAKGLGGQGLSFQLPDLELRDVGKEQGGATAGEVAAFVTSTLQQKIAVRVLTNVEALRRGGLEGAIEALRGLVK